MIRGGGLWVFLFAAAAAGCGDAFSSSAALVLEDAGDAQGFDADAGAIARPDVATIGELELDAGDAGDVLNSVYLDAGDAAADAGDAAADVDARSCVVVNLGACAVAGFPYPARCDGTYLCCCATP